MEQLLIKIPSEQLDFVTQLLSQLKFEVEVEKVDEPTNKLCKKDEEKIAEGIRQANAGQTKPFEELHDEIKQWLTK